MPYALGIELGSQSVRFLTSTSSPAAVTVPAEGASPSPTELSPVLYVDGDLVRVGPEAVERAKAQPAGLVTDVVAQFTVDRLWLAGGRMLTPADAMRELLGGVALAVADEVGEPPYAVTVTAPATWDDDAVGNLMAVVVDMRLARPHVVAGADVFTAAADATLRLPAAAPIVAGLAPDQPPAGPTIERASSHATGGALPEPIRSHLQRPSRWGAAAAVGGLIAVLVAAVVIASRRSDVDKSAGVTTATSQLTRTIPTSGTPAQPLVLGVMTTGPASGAVEQARAELRAAGGVWGHEVGVVAASSTPDPGAAVQQIVGGGAMAMASDAPADVMSMVADTAGALDMAICGPNAVAGANGTVVVGGMFECTIFLALAAENSTSPERARVAAGARELLHGAGLLCDNFRRCQELIRAGQLIDYQPFGQPLRLAVEE